MQKVGRRAAGRGQERVQNHGLAVQAQIAPLGFQLALREPPVQAAAGRPVPGRPARLVNQFGQDARALVRREDVQRREVRDERPAGIDHLPKARRFGLDLLAEVDRLVRVLLPREPRLDVALPPRLMVAATRRRREAGVEAPRQVRVHLLDARFKERAPLPLPEVGDGRQPAVRLGEGGGPAEQIEIDPRVGVDA